MKSINQDGTLLLIAAIAVAAIAIRLMFKFHLDPYFSPYIGVVIGASLGWIGSLLNSWINNNSEKRKRKSQIKYELLGTYHNYYQYLKAQITVQNQKDFYSKRYEIYRNNKADPEVVQINKEFMNDASNKFDKVYHLMQDYEAKLCSLQYEIKDLYLEEIDAQSLISMINKVINRGNTFSKEYRVINYANVTTIEQINEIGETINEEIYKNELKMFDDGETIKKQMLELLNPV